MSTETPAARLRDANHPYYCSEGNFYKAGPDVHTSYESWADFHEDWGNTDEDMNLVFRWDWKVPDPNDYDDGEELPAERLCVYWVLQRKAILRSTECVVTAEDEPAVREWLTKRAKTIAAIWAPIAVVGGAR